MRRLVEVHGNPPRTIDTDIPGWIYPRDLLLLATISQLVPDYTLFVEVGSWLGRSSLAIGANINHKARLHCVDPWTTDMDNYSIEDRVSAFESGAMEYGRVNRVSETMLDNFRNACDMAKGGSWLPAFLRFTDGCGITTWPVQLEKYKPMLRMTSTVFLDAQRAIDNDITPGGDPNRAHDNLTQNLDIFGANRDMLIIGNDFSPSWSSHILAVGKNKEKSRRSLYCPADSALWFLWPVTGHWAGLLGEFAARAERDRMGYWKGEI